MTNRIDEFVGKKIIGYKKAWRFVGDKHYDVLVTLEIGPRTRRVQPRDYKCRAARAKVLAIETLKTKRSVWFKLDEVGGRKIKFAVSKWDRTFRYGVGKVVKPKKKYDPSENSECRSGIHFFLTRQEARNY
jgi:Family of unknown function (DUF5758)